MIRFLTGRVLSKGLHDLVVDVSGVGYGVLVAENTSAKAQQGEEVSLHVYTHVREQEISLYGFMDLKERQMFEMLIGVSGIGPKAALSILSVADVGALAAAILNKDISILTNVSGIGKKTAEKVVIELQGKVDGFALADASGALRDSKAVDALKSMGYSVGEARAALEGVDPEVKDVSERIKLALKSLG